MANNLVCHHNHDIFVSSATKTSFIELHNWIFILVHNLSLSFLSICAKHPDGRLILRAIPDANFARSVHTRASGEASARANTSTVPPRLYTMASHFRQRRFEGKLDCCDQVGFCSLGSGKPAELDGEGSKPLNQIIKFGQLLL